MKRTIVCSGFGFAEVKTDGLRTFSVSDASEPRGVDFLLQAAFSSASETPIAITESKEAV